MANTNLYHVFYKMPALRKEDMYVELEELAEKLVYSGLLRIDAEPKQNFTRFSQPTRNVNIVFSKRELYQEHLQDKTKTLLRKALLAAGIHRNIDEHINQEISKLKHQLKKHVEVEPELEMQISRILVQSAHPVVILMIILEQVQIFISYGNNIGEVMDIVSWQQAGTNSGMQSTDGKNVAVFVSCGGDPLLLNPPSSEPTAKDPILQGEKKTHGDGTPALARMMGIAGQETGHYSDIIHNAFGQQIDRYSANFSGTRANPKVDLARNTDLNNINTSRKLLDKIGHSNLIEKEKMVQFYQRNPDKPMIYYFNLLAMIIAKNRFIHLAHKIKFWPIDEMKKQEFLGTSLEELLGDMAFNLAPKADVYSHADKNVETAIACIEALARVPQQVNKWGHRCTLFLWRNLYKFYYQKLIPGCIRDYEQMSGITFTLYPNTFRRYTLLEKLNFKFDAWKNKIKKKFKKK